MRSALSLSLLLLLASCAHRSPPSTASTATTSARDTALESSLSAIASSFDGTVAVGVRHLRTGAFASIHGSTRLPMMSVFKLPLAVVALSMVEEGRWTLDQRIEISEAELRPGVSPIADEWMKGEHAPTLETMLVRVIQDSDNTAGDKLVSLEGGGNAVTQHLRSLGIAGIDVAEQEIEIFARLECPGVAAPPTGWTFPAIDACPKPTPAEHLAAARHEIETAPNGATPDALVDLLASIDRGTILSGKSRAFLHDTLAGTQTGPRRLRAGLPPGTRLEHKTGTGGLVEGLDVATNDVGIVSLPDGGRFAIAVLTAGSHRDDAAREAVIASLARAAWEHFTR